MPGITKCNVARRKQNDPRSEIFLLASIYSSGLCKFVGTEWSNDLLIEPLWLASLKDSIIGNSSIITTLGFVIYRRELLSIWVKSRSVPASTISVVRFVVFSVHQDLPNFIIFFVANSQKEWTKREARRLMEDLSIWWIKKQFLESRVLRRNNMVINGLEEKLTLRRQCYKECKERYINICLKRPSWCLFLESRGSVSTCHMTWAHSQKKSAFPRKDPCLFFKVESCKHVYHSLFIRK